MAKKKFICIRCPRGCEIQTTLDGYEITSIKGNVCRLGQDYVKTEISDPRRIVTTTVRVRNGSMPLAPVWTDAPVPKDRMQGIMEYLKDIQIEAPVTVDQIVVDNIMGLNVNIRSSGFVGRI